MKSVPKIEKLVAATNLCDLLDDEKIDRIGREAQDGYNRDRESRKQWESRNAEAMKLAFADREAFYGDPKFVDVPMQTLLSDAYNAVGYAEQFSIRGFKLDNASSYRKDGLAISADAQIPLENKERLEVLKGLSGLQAGVAAPGGIVNYVTKRPTKVAEILRYNDPRPRTVETLSEPSFIQTKKLSLEIFQREVRR